MADLVSRTFHFHLVPCLNRNLPPKHFQRTRISAPIPLFKRWITSFTHHNQLLHYSTSSSNSVPEEGDEDVHIITSTERSDGSFVFQFGNASELREKMDELEREKLASEGVEEGGKAGVGILLSDGVEKFKVEEVAHDLGEEIESSSMVAVGVADQKENVILDNESETALINDSQTIDGDLMLGSVEDGDDQLGILSEDVAAEVNGVSNGSEEDSQVDSHKEVFVSTVTPESDLFSDQNNGASGNVEEKDEADEGHSVDGKTNNLIGGVDADSSELVPVSTLESEQVVYGATTNLIGGDDAELSELIPAPNMAGGVDADSNELTPATNNLTGVDDADVSESMPTPNDVAGGVDAGLSESMPAPNNVAGNVDADLSELMPATNTLADGVDANSSESVPSTNNLVGSVDADSIELMPATNNMTGGDIADLSESPNNVVGGVDANLSELVPSTNNLIVGVDADLSELMPVFTSLESELIANDEETTHHSMDDSIDAIKMGNSPILHDLVPSLDSENRMEVSNTERSDYEDPSHLTAPEIDSVEMACHGVETSRTELFLVSGVAFLPHPSKALTGREDAYFISHQNWLAVADGVGQWSFEGSNAGPYMRELMEKCENIVSNCENISTIKPAEVLSRSAAETQSPGSSSILFAYFDGQALHAANVGNTGFIIIRDGSIFKKSTATFHEFSFPLQIVNGHDPSEIIVGYKIDLNEGDVIIFATNGLFDNLYEQEIASIISKSQEASLRPQEIAEFLAMRAQEVGRSTSTRSPFADAAQAVGYVGYSGGKLDDVTVIVSFVQTK